MLIYLTGPQTYIYIALLSGFLLGMGIWTLSFREVDVGVSGPIRGSFLLERNRRD